MPRTGRILVISPDEAMRLSLCFALEVEGYDVGLAESALGRMVGASHADCVVIDDTALKEVKAAGRTLPPCPVIVLAERAEETAWFCSHGLVEKPLLGQALIDLVERALPLHVPVPAMAASAAT